jgi:hypothetical protein
MWDASRVLIIVQVREASWWIRLRGISKMVRDIRYRIVRSRYMGNRNLVRLIVVCIEMHM